MKCYGHKIASSLFSQMLAVIDGERSQIGIFITQLWYIYLNKVIRYKKLKDGIAACYETWFYENP